MKKYLFCVLIALGACKDDDDPAPVANDPLIGKWEYSNNPNELDLSVTFEVAKDGDDYILENVAIEFPSEISEGEVFNYDIVARDKFTDNSGFGFLQIHGGNDTNWIFINLTDNLIQKEGPFTYRMTTSEMEVVTMNDDPILLENQAFVKEEHL